MKRETASKHRAETPRRHLSSGRRAAVETRVARPFHAWLHYHVLSGVEASAPRPLRAAGWRAWVEPLAAAMPLDAERARHLPLLTEDYPSMRGGAGEDALGRALRDAWTLEHDAVAAAWQADDGYAARLDRFWAEAAGPLARCREALWGGRPPQLNVIDVPTVGERAPACSTRRGRVVAVDLGAPTVDVLCRLLHREAQAGTLDPTAPGVEAGHRPTQTNREALVSARLEQIVAAHAPELLDDVRRWPRQIPAACD